MRGPAQSVFFANSCGVIPEVLDDISSYQIHVSLRQAHPPATESCTGTHAALAKEVAEMLRRFAGTLLGTEIEAVLEVVDDDQGCLLYTSPSP